MCSNGKWQYYNQDPQPGKQPYETDPTIQADVMQPVASPLASWNHFGST